MELVLLLLIVLVVLALVGVIGGPSRLGVGRRRPIAYRDDPVIVEEVVEEAPRTRRVIEY